MLLPRTRYVLAISLFFSSFIVFADSTSTGGHVTGNDASSFAHSTNETSSFAHPTQSDVSTIDSPRKIAHLEDTHSKIKHTLDNLGQQSVYLQTSLSSLDKQLKQLEFLQRQSPTPGNDAQLKELHEEYQQIQNNLIVLQQQSGQLQERVSIMADQLTQLHHTLDAIKDAGPPPLSRAEEAAINAPIVEVVQPQIHPASVRTNTIPVGNTSTETVTTTVVESTDTSGGHGADINLNTSAHPTTDSDTSGENVADKDGNTSTPPPVDPNLLPTPDKIVPVTEAELQQAETTNTQPVALTQPAPPPEPSFFSQAFHDPVTLLRLGGVLVVVALFLLIFLFWPRTKKVAPPPNPNAFSAWKPMKEQRKEEKSLKNRSVVDEIDTDIEPEYDFMSTKDAIPARLDLARGYLEMHKYAEAREAITPVFEQGNAAQKQEASSLLQKIVKAEIG